MKSYDIAHIYPLNPKPEELIELQGEKKLTIDPNDLGNLIPLCHGCHEVFDNPRTKAGYREIMKLKTDAVLETKRRSEWHEGNIRPEIGQILKLLSTLGSSNLSGVVLSYDPKKVDDKVDSTLPDFSIKVIKFHNSEYYKLIRDKFQELESVNTGIGDIIAQQVKLQFTKIKAIDSNQQKILEALIDWVRAKSPESSRDACHIVVSFYVQNCEVF